MKSKLAILALASVIALLTTGAFARVRKHNKYNPPIDELSELLRFDGYDLAGSSAMSVRPQKITFANMRHMGVRGLLSGPMIHGCRIWNHVSSAPHAGSVGC